MQKNIQNEEILFAAKGEKNEELDFALPEYLPGIARIAGCFASVCDCDEKRDGANIAVSANIKITLLYISEIGGKIKSATFFAQSEIPLSQGQELQGEVKIFPSCHVVFCTSTATQSRSVKVRLGLACSAVAVQMGDIFFYGEDGDEHIHVKKQTIQGRQKATLTNAVMTSDCDITLKENEKEIGSVVMCDGYAKDIKTTVGDGKADIDFVLEICALYETAENDGDGVEYSFLSSPVKISTTLENALIASDSSVYLTIDVCDISPSVSFDSFGENRNVSFTVKYSVGGFAAKNDTVEVVTDVFCDRCECESSLGNVGYKCLLKSLDSVAHLSERISSDIGALSSVSCANCRINAVNTSIIQGRIFAVAKCSVDIFGANDRGELLCRSYPLNLQVPTDIAENPAAVPEMLLSCIGCDAFIKEGAIVGEFDIRLVGEAVEKMSISAVLDIEMGECDTKKDGCEIVICYPTSADTLWDIAKKYRTSPEKITSLNSLENGSISGKKTLLVM